MWWRVPWCAVPYLSPVDTYVSTTIASCTSFTSQLSHASHCTRDTSDFISWVASSLTSSFLHLSTNTPNQWCIISFVSLSVCTYIRDMYSYVSLWKNMGYGCGRACVCGDVSVWVWLDSVAMDANGTTT